MMCKKAVRKYLNHELLWWGALVNHKVSDFSWENQPCGGTKTGRIPPTLNVFDFVSHLKKKSNEIIDRFPVAPRLLYCRSNESLHQRWFQAWPCCTFRVCCCPFCVNAALWVVQEAALPVMSPTEELAPSPEFFFSALLLNSYSTLGKSESFSFTLCISIPYSPFYW